MSETTIGIACLVVAFIGVVIQLPGALVAIHQVRTVGTGGSQFWRQIAIVAVCLSVAVIGIAVLVQHHSPLQASPSSAPTNPPQSVQPSPKPTATTTPPPVQPPKRTTQKNSKPRMSSGQQTESTQEGEDNQQNVVPVQGPVIQANGGGCNQQVIGGNNNTNTCVPPERHLTQRQKDGLIALAGQIPKECMVVFSSGDAGEPQAFAKEMHDLWTTVGTTRDPGTFFGWHPKGIYFEVKSADESCAPYGLKLEKGMSDLGFDVKGASTRSAISSSSEIHVLVGDP